MEKYNINLLKNFFEEQQRALTFQELSELVSVKAEQKQRFGAWINTLHAEGALYLCSKTKTYSITAWERKFEGFIRVNEKNFGFVSPDNQKTSDAVFVTGKHFNGALNGDKVVGNCFKVLYGEERSFGVIEKILERKRQNLVGFIGCSFNKQKVFFPLDSRLKGLFHLENIASLAFNQVVETQIVEFEKGVIQLKLLRVLGDINLVGVDIDAVLAHHRITREFPKEVEEQAAKFGSFVKESSFKGRKDLRKKIIFTVDGEQTKDFDDAISVEEGSKPGNFILGVHVADVAHYVKENSPLDQEARKRSTSIYFLDQVIPMIPTLLSDGLCSLVPNQDRLTLTMETEINNNGKSVWVRVYPSVINSCYRLTYKQVDSFLKGKRNSTAELANSLNLAAKLSKILRKKKLQEGYCDLEIQESVLIVDKNQEVKSIRNKIRGESELIIEDFMVRANENVAEILVKKLQKAVFRIHPTPSIEKITYLQNLLHYLGIDFAIPLPYTSREFAESVEQIKAAGKLFEFTKNALLRSLERATYSAENSGHFGLASANYLHFTSPLRRYPDLYVHRLLRELVFKTTEFEQRKGELLAEVEEIAQHATTQEHLAVEVERDISNWKRIRFYQKKIGRVFLAEIISIERNGVFCELEDKTVGWLSYQSCQEEFEVRSFEAVGESITLRAGEKIWVELVEVEGQTFCARLLFRLTNPPKTRNGKRGGKSGTG